MEAESTSPGHADSSMLAPFLRDRYPAVKARYPGEGRRKWRLRVADAFWALSPAQKAAYLATGAGSSDAGADFVTDDDPLDALSGDAPGLGILVRTDYSHEDAWQAFCGKLHEGEAEFAAARPSDADRMDEDSPDEEGDEEGEEEEQEQEQEPAQERPQIFSIVDAAPADRPRFAGLSNLAALRLLTDVDVRRAPPPPPGAKRAQPPHRLVDHDGWQEVYAGKTVWVYDAQSNADQSVRLVSLQGGPYGTATADSWRARVSHICELQVNLASGAMTIDFGGLDRWTYSERVRNLAEAGVQRVE